MTAVPPGPPAAPPPGPPPSGPGQPGGAWGPPPAAGVPTAKTDGMGIAALVCSIASFFVCPVILAVVALGLAYQSAARIEASGGALGGAGMATAAKVVAWIHLALALAIVVIVDIALIAS